MQLIVQAAVEEARVAVQAMIAVRMDNNDRMQHAVGKIGRTIIQEPIFNWKAEDKYNELKNSYEG